MCDVSQTATASIVNTPSGIALPAPGEMLPRIAEEKDSPTSTSESTTPGFMQTIDEHEGEAMYGNDKSNDEKVKIQDNSKVSKMDTTPSRGDAVAADDSKPTTSLHASHKSKNNESSEY